ncbi:hypothetical protein OGATHE_003310 [Ogataea polymorpha]|uniref:Uncharacterized protein n=1 Tax=Ogataea polymorpha TaxID=460523 RepID=A0A9P8P3Q1_9ASCO|nr:hypothetical protein OGATHE_003310 [Ogataea polymorpha]
MIVGGLDLSVFLRLSTSQESVNLKQSTSSQYLTNPGSRAKMVWSFPIPAFSPGYHLVPRCLIMISPTSTDSPSCFLGPRRLPAESFICVLEPPALFVAVLTWKMDWCPTESEVFTLSHTRLTILDENITL